MNGELLPWKVAKVSFLTHALHYGTGVFEGIRCFKTTKGPAIFRLKEHATRMMESAEIYLMKIPYSPDEIVNAVKTTVSNPLPNKVNLGITAWRWDSYLGEKAEKEEVRCQVSSWRRVHPSTMPPQAKSTANYANGGLAKIEALKAGYDEAILLNMEAMVAEASAENIFRVKDGILSTTLHQLECSEESRETQSSVSLSTWE